VKTNEAGISLIKASESLKLEAYLCPAGAWTIGYGHTGGVRAGQRLTAQQASDLLHRDVERFESSVADLTNDLPLTQNQFSALVSFAFNVGTTALANSTLLRIYRHGVFGAAAEFGRWVNAKGTPLPGLIKRRAAERALFLRRGGNDVA
jgi:lysozyme